MFKADELTPNLEPRRLMTVDRTPTVTPVDLRQARFKSSVRGFDREEVAAMLTEAADGYDQALRENERLRHELVRLESALAQFRELESSLKNTLISAQKVSDDMRAAATQEATRIVREAEGRADLIVQKAEARREELERDLSAIKAKRRDAETGLETIIATLRGTLDEFRMQQAQALRDERVLTPELLDVERVG
jgi:cell division initiation protein